MYLFAELEASFAGSTSRTRCINGVDCEGWSAFKGVRVASEMTLLSGQEVLIGGASTTRTCSNELSGGEYCCSASADIRSLAIKIDLLSGQEGLMGGDATRMLLLLSELGLSGLGSILNRRSSALR